MPVLMEVLLVHEELSISNCLTKRIHVPFLSCVGLFLICSVSVLPD